MKFFENYTVLVTEVDLVLAMREQVQAARSILGHVSDVRAGRVDPPFAWTIKQVTQHVIDAERVFGYRAMRFSRGDTTPLPGFDENAYAAAVDVSARSVAGLLDEWSALRGSHVAMFQNISADAWERIGTASGIEWAVRDLAKAIIGHARHHLQIIEKRLQA